MTRDEVWLLEEKYEGVESEAFHADCKRLEAGEPLAYVIGHVPFLSCTMYLDSRPLIPRPETEFWVEKAITVIRAMSATEPRPLRVLDLCAGSGCIGIAVAKTLPETHITFTELDKAHLPTIARNLKENGIDCTRYRVFQSDLFENVTGDFDFILSNPPYIDPALDRTEPSVKAHEPAIALYGGVSGMELIKRTIADTPTHLTPTGQLWLEHEPEQAPAIQKYAAKAFTPHTHHDQYGVARYTQLVRKDS